MKDIKLTKLEDKKTNEQYIEQLEFVKLQNQELSELNQKYKDVISKLNKETVSLKERNKKISEQLNDLKKEKLNYDNCPRCNELNKLNEILLNKIDALNDEKASILSSKISPISDKNITLSTIFHKLEEIEKEVRKNRRHVVTN
jgi:uncharacterized phage infection (PIP) family protein YhgE